MDNYCSTVDRNIGPDIAMAGTKQPSSHEPRSREAEIQEHAVRLMYQRMGGPAVHMFLVPAIIAYALWDHLNHVVLASWALVACIVYGARMALSYFYKRISPDIHQARRWSWNRSIAARVMHLSTETNYGSF